MAVLFGSWSECATQNWGTSTASAPTDRPTDAIFRGAVVYDRYLFLSQDFGGARV